MFQVAKNNSGYLYGFEGQENDKRRAERGNRKSYEIKQLWQRQHEIIRMALIGMDNKDIARALGITKESVSMTLNSQIVKEKLSLMRAVRDAETIDVAQEITKLYRPALQVYEDILAGEQISMNLKKQVADTVLMDIGGHKAPTKIQGNFAHAHLSREDIAELVRRGKEAAAAAGMLYTNTNAESEVIDATAE
jgi:DNA-binding CsgD family transcriptional regulator